MSSSSSGTAACRVAASGGLTFTFWRRPSAREGDCGLPTRASPNWPTSSASATKFLTRESVHCIELFHQKRDVAERLAARSSPVDATLLVDQNRRVQFHFFEIVIGMEAMRI